MQKINYDREMEEVIRREQKAGRTPTLLLHACCAPCSSAVLERLSEYFRITVFYYNPNITESAEYRKRVSEEQRLIAELPVKNPVSFLEGKYDPESFFAAAKGLEEVPEGGERCFRCFKLRLDESAKAAREGGFDYMTTSLTISPLKNAEKLNTIGAGAAEECGVTWLCSDFKKKNGYKRSVELSAEYGLYRQDYCGCVFSKMQREREKAARAAENTERNSQ